MPQYDHVPIVARQVGDGIRQNQLMFPPFSVAAGRSYRADQEFLQTHRRLLETHTEPFKRDLSANVAFLGQHVVLD